MKNKLFLVEGLPGAGKTTISNLVHRLLLELNKESRLFQEGDLNHPCDFERVSCFGEEEYLELKQIYRDFVDESLIRKEGQNYFIPYGKLNQKFQQVFPDSLYKRLFAKDIYELPFVENRKWITQNWERFGKSAEKDEMNYVFECCFIQNPVTVGMIKYGVSDETVMAYVEDLAEAISGLNPLLIYVQQDDIDATFTKAAQERPKEWLQGFIDYYTNQGYGKNHALEGFSGTVEVLKVRRKLEEEILNHLNMQKIVINNSHYDLDEVTSQLKSIINRKGQGL